MIKYQTTKQLSIEEFKTPFELKLHASNRWVKLSSLIPWEELVSIYTKSMSRDKGAPGIDARIAVGALLIKHRLSFSDEETIETIRENPYLQYFLGLNVYHPEPLFDTSLFVTLRKRMGLQQWDAFNKLIIQQAQGIDIEGADGDEPNPNIGMLQIDATVSDQYIKYPTDIELLNDSREWSQKIIDEIYVKSDIEKKPRTYRRIARKEFLMIAKKKNKKKKELRKAIRKQLNYLKRNFIYIEKMLDEFKEHRFPLSKRSQRYYWVIQEVYLQQLQMYSEKNNSCADRIVSIHQPHVRPIVRGKSGKKVEFGSKMSLSLDNGYSRINRLSWDAYNESTDLKDQVEAYKSIHGYYPDLVNSDRIYANRENRMWLKERGIRQTASPLGRKSSQQETPYQKRKRKKEARERNQIEGKFGQGKNAYELNRIRARLSATSESWIGCTFCVMNLVKLYQQFSI